jgi:hypothetical protein
MNNVKLKNANAANGIKSYKKYFLKTVEFFQIKEDYILLKISYCLIFQIYVKYKS